MLTVAPTGRTNLEINLLILFFSSVHLRVVGSAAVLSKTNLILNLKNKNLLFQAFYLEAVARAISNASIRFFV